MCASVRNRRTLASLGIAALLAAGCGGGSDEPPVVEPVSARLEAGLRLVPETSTQSWRCFASTEIPSADFSPDYECVGNSGARREFQCDLRTCVNRDRSVLVALPD